MSAITSSTSSLTGAAYATQLAQAAAIKRSLANLGTAIQSGDLAPANTILAAFFKANPQYVTAASDDSTSQNPLNQDFQNLATALSNNQVDAAQTAWAQIKTDFASQGVTNLDGSTTTSTAQVVAQATESMDTEVLSDMFGTSSSDSSSLAALLGGSTSSSDGSTSGVSSSLIGQWLTYQQSGTNKATATPASNNISNLLNIAA